MLTQAISFLFYNQDVTGLALSQNTGFHNLYFSCYVTSPFRQVPDWYLNSALGSLPHIVTDSPFLTTQLFYAPDGLSTLLSKLQILHKFLIDHMLFACLHYFSQ